MPATLADFRAQFPDEPFASTPDAKVQRLLNVALSLHSVNETATLYCAAHLLALMAEEDATSLEPDGGAGVVEQESIGPRTVGYVTQAQGDKRRAFYATTAYGRMFLALEERTPTHAMGILVA